MCSGIWRSAARSTWPRGIPTRVVGDSLITSSPIPQGDLYQFTVMRPCTSNCVCFLRPTGKGGFQTRRYGWQFTAYSKRNGIRLKRSELDSLVNCPLSRKQFLDLWEERPSGASDQGLGPHIVAATASAAPRPTRRAILLPSQRPGEDGRTTAAGDTTRPGGTNADLVHCGPLRCACLNAPKGRPGWAGWRSGSW